MVEEVVLWLILIFFFYLASQRISDQNTILLPIKSNHHIAVKYPNLPSNSSLPLFFKTKVRS